MYGFDYSISTLSVTINPGTTSENVTTPSVNGMKSGRQVLKISGEFLLLNGRSPPESI